MEIRTGNNRVLTLEQAQKKYQLIPEMTLYGIFRYVNNHCPPGDFLRAVFSNDLRESFARSDVDNQLAIFEVMQLLYTHVPSGCYGSPEAVNEWLSRKEG